MIRSYEWDGHINTWTHSKTAFELWCWRRLLRVPWSARSSNQSILKQITPEYSLEALMLKLKLQYFGHLMWRTDSLEKTLMLEKIECGRRRGRQRMRRLDVPPTQWTWVWASSGNWWWTGKHGVLQSMGSQRVRHNWVAELNWYFNYWKNKGLYIVAHLSWKLSEDKRWCYPSFYQKLIFDWT